MCESAGTEGALLRYTTSDPTLVKRLTPYLHRYYEIMTKFKRFVIFIDANRGENCAQLNLASLTSASHRPPIVNSINSILNATSGSELNIGGYRCYKRWKNYVWKADLL